MFLLYTLSQSPLFFLTQVKVLLQENNCSDRYRKGSKNGHVFEPPRTITTEVNLFSPIHLYYFDIGRTLCQATILSRALEQETTSR